MVLGNLTQAFMPLRQALYRRQRKDPGPSRTFAEAGGNNLDSRSSLASQPRGRRAAVVNFSSDYRCATGDVHFHNFKEQCCLLNPSETAYGQANNLKSRHTAKNMSAFGCEDFPAPSKSLSGQRPLQENT